MRMTCPHCGVHTDATETVTNLIADTVKGGWWRLQSATCTDCQKKTLVLEFITGARGSEVADAWRVWPKAGARRVPDDVSKEIKEDFLEACVVLADSPKASAALSRRCLQHLLEAEAEVTPGTLDSEIAQVIESRQLPSRIADDLDMVRTVGNFAAHPTKSKSTGEIVPVESHEAEWNLVVIESLFDVYYVQPKKQAERRAMLDQKLDDAGKPTLKSQSSDSVAG